MTVVQRTLELRAPRAGLHEITREVAAAVAGAGVRAGTATLFVQHTSASLLIQENADPTARHDLERWFERLAPENDPRYRHTSEGPDDMPAHLRAAVTATALTLPVTEGRPALGTWQGIYLFEHRQDCPPRRIVLTVMGE